MSIVQIPLRLASGAFILNSGLSKRKLTDEQAAHVRDMGAKGVPYIAQLSPAQFRTFISSSEIGIGGALLLPLVWSLPRLIG